MNAAQENFSNLLGGLATGDMKAVQEGLMGIRGSIVASSQAAWLYCHHLLLYRRFNGYRISY
jgi:hypothetical protein